MVQIRDHYEDFPPCIPTFYSSLLEGKSPGIELLGVCVFREEAYLHLPIIILDDGNVATLQAKHVLAIGGDIVPRPIGFV